MQVFPTIFPWHNERLLMINCLSTIQHLFKGEKRFSRGNTFSDAMAPHALPLRNLPPLRHFFGDVISFHGETSLRGKTFLSVWSTSSRRREGLMTPRERSSPHVGPRAHTPSSAQTKKARGWLPDLAKVRTLVAPWWHFPFFSARYYRVKAAAPAGCRVPTMRCSKGHFSGRFSKERGEGDIIRLGISLSTRLDILWSADPQADSRKLRENIWL